MYQHIVFRGRKVAYRSDGTGVPLVLLHGFCEDSTIWDEFITYYDNIRVIRVDLSGHGQSEVLPEDDIMLMAESVKAVLDALSVTRCVMVGHSMGGYVATAFVEKWPDMLTGLGMFHSHPFEDTPEKKVARAKSLAFVEKFGRSLFVKQLIPSLFANLFATSNEQLINKLIHNAIQYPSGAIVGALRAMLARPDRAHVLENIACPVLFIIGKQDTTVPYDISLKQIHLPAVADIHILPRVAHMGMFRSTAETAGIVRNFVQFCQLGTETK